MSHVGTADIYRYRLAAAGWGWMEVNRHGWYRGKYVKDRRSGRAEKRGARQADRQEIVAEASP